MDLSELALIRLSDSYPIKPFDCGDNDLNEFLLGDSKNYYSQLLAVTYLLEFAEETAAFFSLLNDKISIEDADSKRKWRKIFRDIMPEGKRFKSYPAVKIGRLGVGNTFQGDGLGTVILDYVKELFIDNNRTGCKYLTVDAYLRSLRFYEKNGFEYLTEKDKDSETRLMYFDLTAVA
ncbi:MAG: GNAT family N-acetyltransferase [Flavobacteriales bacterium]|nr:GNAT family N-acetyltransferase [Flavobacteriales bacterium]